MRFHIAIIAALSTAVLAVAHDGEHTEDDAHSSHSTVFPSLDFLRMLTKLSRRNRDSSSYGRSCSFGRCIECE